MSAKDTDSDITLGLGLGADDYVTKPFSMVQVLARIKANLRRTGQYAASSPARPSLLTVGELRMNLEDYTVSKQGKEIELTRRNLKFCVSFCRIPGRYIPRNRFIPSSGMTPILAMKTRLTSISAG